MLYNLHQNTFQKKIILEFKPNDSIEIPTETLNSYFSKINERLVSYGYWIEEIEYLLYPHIKKEIQDCLTNEMKFIMNSFVVKIMGYKAIDFRHLQTYSTFEFNFNLHELGSFSNIGYFDEKLCEDINCKNICNWGYSNVEISNQIQHMKNDVLIGVIDSGITPIGDIANFLWEDSNGKKGIDIERNYDVLDTTNHGTSVAWTIMNLLNFSSKVKLLNLKVPDDFSEQICINSLLFAYCKGADVINCCWVPSHDNCGSQIFQKVVKIISSKECILIFAAGNKSNTIDSIFPLNYSEIISVGAVDERNNWVSTTSTGKKIFIMGPGYNVYSKNNNNKGVCHSGTSCAAPFVTGFTAVLKSHNKKYKVSEIKKILRDAASPMQSKNGSVDSFSGTTGVVNGKNIKL